MTQFMVDTSGSWSGGGRVFLDNARYAAQRHPIMSGGPNSIPIIPRNVPVARRQARPYVLVPQNAWPWTPKTLGAKERVKVAALRISSEWYLRRSAGYLRISSAIPALGRAGATSPILHNVLDEKFDRDHAANVEPPRGSEGAIVAIGSANSYRGFDVLLDAHARYRREGGAHPLFIAGPASNPRYVAMLEQLARGRSDVTLRWGSLNRASCLAAYRVSHGVVLPSYVEASPLSLLEALSATPRVIASDIAGHREIVNGPVDHRSFFTAGDPSALAASLHGLDLVHSGAAHTSLADAGFRLSERNRWADSFAAWLHDLAPRLGH